MQTIYWSASAFYDSVLTALEQETPSVCYISSSTCRNLLSIEIVDCRSLSAHTVLVFVFADVEELVESVTSV